MNETPLDNEIKEARPRTKVERVRKAREKERGLQVYKNRRASVRALFRATARSFPAPNHLFNTPPTNPTHSLASFSIPPFHFRVTWAPLLLLRESIFPGVCSFSATIWLHYLLKLCGFSWRWFWNLKYGDAFLVEIFVVIFRSIFNWIIEDFSAAYIRK